MIREIDVMRAATATKARIRTEPHDGQQTVPRKQPRLFHARMLVTRLEEWCVEAATPDEAQALLAAGAGHRCSPGESVHAEVESLLDE